MEYQRTTKPAQKEQSRTPSSSLHQTSLNRITSHPLLQLQRTIGNQAVLNMLRSGNMHTDTAAQAFVEPRFGHDFSRIPIHSTQTAVPQTKLKVDQPENVYEQEADQVAGQVMRMADPETPASGDQDQAKNSLMLMRSREPEANGATESPDVLPAVHAVLNSDGGKPLDTTTRALMEPRFGYDFSQVRVHDDEHAAVSAQAVNAWAYTVGRDVVFNVGKYAPATRIGQYLLAHELAHVVQQGHAGFLNSAVMRKEKTSASSRSESELRELAKRPGQALDIWKQLSPEEQGRIVVHMISLYGRPFADEFQNAVQRLPHRAGLDTFVPETSKRPAYTTPYTRRELNARGFQLAGELTLSGSSSVDIWVRPSGEEIQIGVGPGGSPKQPPEPTPEQCSEAGLPKSIEVPTDLDEAYGGISMMAEKGDKKLSIYANGNRALHAKVSGPFGDIFEYGLIYVRLPGSPACFARYGMPDGELEGVTTKDPVERFQQKESPDQ